MELTPLANILTALVILLVIAAVFTAAQIKLLRSKVARLSYSLYFEVTRKTDLIPQFVGKLASYMDLADWQKIIDWRDKSMSMAIGSTGKRKLEDDMWKQFSSLWQQAKKHPEVQKDFSILALEKEIRDADKRIEGISTVYNRIVNKYNGLVDNFLLKPVAFLVKAGRLENY